ncbi:MAG TPA: DUF2167 domain-containing protein [Candidatus Polarisedimenticolaceae bacterium]|nr:DUF2167 domain-containing protein [Candidatus Polarisedimenticolaceae bacterium]
MCTWCLRKVAILFCLLAVTGVLAEEPKGVQMTAEEFEAKLGYQTGTVQLPGGIATIRLPESFRFIGAEGSRRLLTEGWGNPPVATEGVLGMLIPTATSPLSKEGWGVVITFDEDGFVNDDDAAKIDYDKMLSEMQKGMAEANAERKKQGYEAVTLIGWAERPSYDAAAHKIYWAKELAFEGKGKHTLNYNIRILGRRGVLVLNAVSGIDQLPAIRQETQSLLSAVEFNEGHRYADYLPGKDKVAKYGIAGLIVGGVATVAAKAGLFKMLWVGLLAAKKFIFVGIVALFAWLKKLFTKSNEDTTPDPSAPSGS